ncbi:MAG: 2,3-bisphosphoglycerate-independent phosphoglycerate mutase [Oscillospiraceae bacterium]|jgi:2,3-bisphosphoglycerate-independent phosphoglycerate mutase|nr:2,3-bisphosphoglycerate-independent phosphoglycerate mutase [Oscillospiraceae bacterium]
MKYILLIGDGMADLPLDALNGKTPLEVAVTPVTDSLAKISTLGTALTCPPPLKPGSDTAIMTIFGCDPAKLYFGRAPLEAAAQGVTVPDGALAFRCNMASIAQDEKGTFRMKSHSAGGIDGESARALIEALIADPEFAAELSKANITIYPTDSYRHIVVQRLKKPSRLTMYPPHDNLGKPVAEILPRGGDNADTLADIMMKSYEILSKSPINLQREAEGKLPANCVWFWAQGTSAQLPSFYSRYAKTGAVISAVPLVQGIGALQGLDVIRVPGATGELDTNYEGKAAAALDALKTRDFAAVHVEAPDECTHNGDIPGKVQAIENIDTRVLKPILDGLSGQSFRLLFLSDHYTLGANGMHDATPVPYLLYDSDNAVLGCDRLTERCAASGELIAGLTLMDLLFAQL